MSEQDPPRLSQIDDGENDLLRDAIEDSKRDLPDETRLAAIALKLGPGILGGAAAAGGGGGGAAAAASGAGAAKASVAPAAAKIGAMSASMKLATAAAVAVAIGGGAIVVPKIISPSTSAVTVAPTSNATSAPSATSSSATNLALPPASASVAQPSPFASMKPLVIPQCNADEETKAIQQAQDSLKSDPDYALAQCDDAAKLFPNCTLAQEREVVAIDALTRLGRMPEAKARAKKFASDFPNSAQLPRVQHLIGKN